jgi:uncharacterized protein (DUF2147 family)
MNKVGTLFLFLFLLMSPILHSEEVIGFWKTINDKSGQPESIVAVYEYQGKYYGRIVATYDMFGNIGETIDRPKDRAPGVVGNPFYNGLDILWDLKKEGSKYVDGKILDPEKGKVYDAKMWLDNGKLIVRGELLIFGRNEKWLPVKDGDFPSDFKKPDLNQFVPSIPKVTKH